MLTFHIITLFPESFASYLEASIIARAIKNKKIKIKFYNPRDYVTGKNKNKRTGYKRVDDRAYGGGPGMVLQAEPILRAIQKIKSKIQSSNVKKSKKLKVIIFTPAGEQFSNQTAIKLAKNYTDIILVCGRYEGVDQRVAQAVRAQEMSVGPYILTGGELPALVLLDTTSRQIAGVLGKSGSREETRVAGRKVYTRPEVLIYKKKKYRVPKILLSGHHGKIDEWRARGLTP